jgi:hypothetical protein
VLPCNHPDKFGLEEYAVDYVSNTMVVMQYMHIWCFVCLFLAELIESLNRKAFIHNSLYMLSVPVYWFSIFNAFFKAIKAEEENVGCRLKFSERHAWIYIEIISFFVNIILLILHLAAQTPCITAAKKVFGSIFSCKCCPKVGLFHKVADKKDSKASKSLKDLRKK